MYRIKRENYLIKVSYILKKGPSTFIKFSMLFLEEKWGQNLGHTYTSFLEGVLYPSPGLSVLAKLNI